MSAIPDRCRDGASALAAPEIEAMRAELHADWRVEGTASLSRRLEVLDFQAALDLVNAVGAAAEDENHHPDLSILDYRFVVVKLSTHDAGGLTANDFVMARRTDALAGASSFRGAGDRGTTSLGA